MSYTFQRIDYKGLNSPQKESYNFQKVAGHLADYGFNCIRLSDDWQGADFIACHRDGQTFLRVQLKSRMEIDQRYSGKDIYIAFIDRNDDGASDVYVYPHDLIRDQVLALGAEKGTVTQSKSWKERGGYSWNYLSKERRELLKSFKV